VRFEIRFPSGINVSILSGMKHVEPQCLRFETIVKIPLFSELRGGLDGEPPKLGCMSGLLQFPRCSKTFVFHSVGIHSLLVRIVMVARGIRFVGTFAKGAYLC
jgi:hypothetical protein